MAFKSVDELKSHPDARIFFVGQLILEPLKHAKACEVFVNRSAPDHLLSVEIRSKRPNRPDEILMRHFGPLPFVETPPGIPSGSDVPRHGMFILVRPGDPLVEAYNGTIPSCEGEELDLALNMTRIHDVLCGAVEPIGGRPSIYIDRGCFYTADNYPAGAMLKKKKPGSLPKPQPKFAGIIGANIYLAGTQILSVIWRNNGLVETLRLEKSPNQTYEIYITNEPLYQDDSADAPFAHEEFSEFYKILPGVPRDEQFVLLTPPPPADPEPTRGSLRTPCMSVLLDQ